VVETFARVASLRLGEPGEVALFGDSTANTGAGEAVGRFAGPERPDTPGDRRGLGEEPAADTGADAPMDDASDIRAWPFHVTDW